MSGLFEGENLLAGEGGETLVWKYGPILGYDNYLVFVRLLGGGKVSEVTKVTNLTTW